MPGSAEVPFVFVETISANSLSACASEEVAANDMWSTGTPRVRTDVAIVARVGV